MSDEKPQQPDLSAITDSLQRATLAIAEAMGQSSNAMERIGALQETLESCRRELLDLRGKLLR